MHDSTVPSGTLSLPPDIQAAALATGLIPMQLPVVPADICLTAWSSKWPAAQPLDITIIMQPLHQLMVSEAPGHAVQVS